MIVHRVAAAVTDKILVESINTLEELQNLVDTNPELYFNNIDGVGGFGGKFLIAQHQLNFTEDVIYEYAGKGLSFYIMLMNPNLSDELRYYLRVEYYGKDYVNAIYFNPDSWAKNEEHLDKIAILEDKLSNLVCGQCNCSEYDCEYMDLEQEYDELINQPYML